MNVHARTPRLVAAAAVALCLTASAVSAFDPPKESLAQRVASADAVVQAVVQHVEYRMSRPTADQPSIPFTFVTFVVERVVRGNLEGSHLTLRFHGGLFPDGRFLDDPTAPLFDIGERSLLLVTKNGDLDVPLAGWRYGRLRIIDGRVYDDFGRPLSILNSDRVKFGRTVRFDEIAEHALGSTGRSFNPRVRELGTALAPDLGGPGAAAAAAPKADVADTAEAVTKWMGALRSSTAAAIARSVDPNVPFSGRSLRAVAPSR
jgi:hypothetical protein